MIIPFRRPDRGSRRAPRRFRVVVHDEDPEILGLWAAALNTDGYEVDVVPAQSAIEGCELHLDELEPESLYLVPPPTFEERR